MFQKKKTPAVNLIEISQAVDEGNFSCRGFYKPTST